MKKAISCLAFLLLHNLACAEELQTKSLTGYSNNELIELFAKCLNVDADFEKAEEIQGELIKRRAVKETVKFFEDEGNSFLTIEWCYQIFEELRGPETDKLLKQSAVRDITFQSYFANKYFAEIGDVSALEILNENYWMYPVPANERIETVLLFGKYKYYPANRHLVSSLGVANANLAVASLRSLLELYPETRDIWENGGIQDPIDFYSKYIDEHPGSNK